MVRESKGNLFLQTVRDLFKIMLIIMKLKQCCHCHFMLQVKLIIKMVRKMCPDRGESVNVFSLVFGENTVFSLPKSSTGMEMKKPVMAMNLVAAHSLRYLNVLK